MNITLVTARPIDFLQAEFTHRFGYSVGLHLWQEGALISAAVLWKQVEGGLQKKT